MHRPLMMAAVLLTLPAAALAEGQAPRGPETVIAATCADLRPEARALHPECQPLREAAPARSVAAPRALALAEDKPRAKPRRISRLPWMIGVYN